MRAAVELAKDWRTDRYLRRLEAMMIVADKDVSLVLTGTGDVLEPEAGVMAIGSGGNYALAAARALIDTDKDAEAIVRQQYVLVEGMLQGTTYCSGEMVRYGSRRVDPCTTHCGGSGPVHSRSRAGDDSARQAWRNVLARPPASGKRTVPVSLFNRGHSIEDRPAGRKRRAFRCDTR